jgi:hypothetical protein
MAQPTNASLTYGEFATAWIDMTKNRHTSRLRSAEVLRFAVDRAETLSGSAHAHPQEARWAYEAAAVGEVSALAALALLED